MNTITIKLRTSGSIADLEKDFNLYVGGYSNKLIEVYVPKSILYSNEENTFINTVKIGAILTSTSGATVNTNSYYLDYVDDKTDDDVEYAIYEGQLPKEFTVYAGTEQVVINVVNIDNTDEEDPVVLSIITTQTANLPVLQSTYLGDEVVDPTDVELIMAELALKQDSDTTGNTTEINIADISDTKEVVPAINAIGTQVTTNISNITANTEDIAQNTEDIAYIQEHITSGENYVGTYPSQADLPTDEELSAFVVSTIGRNPENGDIVLFTQTVEGGTDVSYKFYYTASDWGYYQIPPIESASNGTLGIVQGTYGIDSTNTTLVDIAGGQIINIWVKDGSDVYRNIREYLNTNATSLANIISGDTSVGYAIKALQDSLGNSIVDTYLTQNSGATKQYVRDYSLPREFNDVYFISADGYSTTIPTTPESGIQFSETSSAIGDLQLFQITKTNDADFELSSKNSSSNGIYVSADQDCTVYFRMTTQEQADGETEWTDLSIELTSPTALTAGEVYKVQLGTTFSSLGDVVLTLTDGDLIRQTFEVITQSSTTTVFDVYSSETYPSTYNMNTQAQTITVAQGDLGEQPVYELTGTLTDNVINFEFDSTTVLNENVEAKFVLSYTVATAPDDTVEMALLLNEETIRLVTPYNQSTGNATVDNFKQTNYLYEAGVQTWTFKGFIQTVGSETNVLVDMDNLSDPVPMAIADADGIEIGLRNRAYVKAIEAISTGQIVMFDSALGNNTLVKLADMSATGFTPKLVVGIAEQDMAVNDFGYVMTYGRLTGIDTKSLAEGTVLYLDPDNAGEFVGTAPTGAYVIPFGFVVKEEDAETSNNGNIIVRFTTYPDGDEINYDETTTLNEKINELASEGSSVAEVIDEKTKLLIYATGSTAFNLYLESGTSKDTNIDWGDDSDEDITEWGTVQHTYETTGYYWITITSNDSTEANMPQLYVNAKTDYALYYKAILSNLYTSVDDRAFYLCSNLASVLIPDSVTSLGNNSFRGCYSLTSIVIPNSITSVGDYCFHQCTALISITFPNTSGLLTIGSYAFNGCISLTSVIFPTVVDTIGSYAFYGCYSLSELTISPDTGTIGDYAFYGCYKLREMKILDETPPALSGTNAIASYITVIYVPRGSLDTYRTATNWSTYASIIQELAYIDDINDLQDDIDNIATTYTTTLPTTSGGTGDWQAVTGGYELAKTITGLTTYDSIVAVASDSTIWTTNELDATLTTDTLTFFVSSLPSAEVTLTYTITKSTNGGSI